jgi:ankyrin repeat protein
LALEAAKLLLERGVDVNATSVNGRTALDLAKGLKYTSVVTYLTEKGAKEGVPGAAGRGNPRGSRDAGRGAR